MLGLINYKWFIDINKKKISQNNIDFLKEQAIERANEMINDGYIEGELCTCIIQDNEEIDIRGWWKHT